MIGRTPALCSADSGSSFSTSRHSAVPNALNNSTPRGSTSLWLRPCYRVRLPGGEGVAQALFRRSPRAWPRLEPSHHRPEHLQSQRSTVTVLLDIASSGPSIKVHDLFVSLSGTAQVASAASALAVAAADFGEAGAALPREGYEGLMQKQGCMLLQVKLAPLLRHGEL